MKVAEKLLCIVFLSLAPALVYAQDKIMGSNHAFSYVELGIESISYGEATQVQGYDLDLSKAVRNPTQRAGGYTPFSENTGFYIQTGTTLDPVAAREEWNIQPFGIVQNNLRKVAWNELSALFAWHVYSTGWHTVAGMGITTLTFTRSDFNKDTGAPAFEAAIAPAIYDVFPGSITEDSTNITANIGLRYDSTFLNPQSRHRFQASLVAGVPVYYKVENSNFPDVQWVENFQGYDINFGIGYAYKFYKDFMLSVHADLLYKIRPETHGEAVAGGVGRIPEVTIWNSRFTSGISWVY